MERAETKAEYIVRAKALLRADLRAKSWPEKVRASARLQAAKRSAQEAMRKREAERSQGEAARVVQEGRGCETDPGTASKTS